MGIYTTMKNILLLLFFPIVLFGQTNVTVAVVSEAPYNVCRGNEIYIRFKMQAGITDSTKKVWLWFKDKNGNSQLYQIARIRCVDVYTLQTSIVNGQTVYTYTYAPGENIPYDQYTIGCHQTPIPVRSMRIEDCSMWATGIEEYESNIESQAIYFDLSGRQIEKRYNELIIEQVGLKRRKIYITR